MWFDEELPTGTWKAAAQAARHCNVLPLFSSSVVVTLAASLADLALATGGVFTPIDPCNLYMEHTVH